MTPRPHGRTEACDRNAARVRLAHAGKFLEVAELVATEGDDVPESRSVSAALAVLAGIAAADAACCALLGQRSRGPDHRQAVALVRQVSPGGDQAAAQLDRLLAVKDGAQYGIIHITAAELRAVLRQAHTLITFAAAAIRQ